MTELKRGCGSMAVALLMLGTATAGAMSAEERANVTGGRASVVVWALGVPAIDPACKPVFDANDKTLDTPNHAYQEHESAGGKKAMTELITVGGQRYLLVNGKWSKSRMTVADTKAQEEENKKNAKVVSCKRVGTDLVNGQAATVYSEHSENDDTKADGKVWISSSGVILKNEIELDTGDATKNKITIRYEYGNVKAPI